MAINSIPHNVTNIIFGFMDIFLFSAIQIKPIPKASLLMSPENELLGKAID